MSRIIYNSLRGNNAIILIHSILFISKTTVQHKMFIKSFQTAGAYYSPSSTHCTCWRGQKFQTVDSPTRKSASGLTFSDMAMVANADHPSMLTAK